MTVQGDVPHYDLPREAPLEAGPFKLRPKVWFWGTLFFAFTVIALTIGAHSNMLLPGFAFSCVLWALYVILFVPQLFENFSATAFALLYRFGIHKGAGVLQRNTYTSSEAEAGQPLPPSSNWGKGKQPKPAVLSHIGKVSFSPVSVDPDRPPVGVVADRRYQTYSGVLRVHGKSLLMAEPGKDGPELRGLQRLLDELANANLHVHRLTWRDQTICGEPQQPDTLIDNLRRGAGLHGQMDLPHTDLVKRRTMEMCEKAVTHTTTMVVTVHSPQVKQISKKLGGVEQVLYGQLAKLYSTAMGASNSPSPVGWRTAGLLSYSQLLWENRMALDPVFAKGYWDMWRDNVSADVLPESVAWPKTADFTYTAYCRLGDTYHVGFYVADFPKEGITLEQFWEIQKVEVPKTIATVIEMVPPHIARRRAEWASNGMLGSQIERRSKHRRITANQELSADEVLQHERIVAARNKVGRIRCYIDVTGASVEEVNDNARAVKAAAFPSGCTLEPMTGRQPQGIEAIALYGRGLAGYSRKWNL